MGVYFLSPYFLPNVWQGDVVLALGNIQKPHSPPAGPLRPFRTLPHDGQAAPLSQLASSWPQNVAFVNIFWVSLHSWGVFDLGEMPLGSEGNDQDPRVRWAWPTKVAPSRSLPLTCCIYSQYPQEESLVCFSSSLPGACNKLRQIIVASSPSVLLKASLCTLRHSTVEGISEVFAPECGSSLDWWNGEMGFFGPWFRWPVGERWIF